MTTAPQSSEYTFHGPGNVNSGSGTQYNYLSVISRRRRDARLVDVEHIEWLTRRFVRPARLRADVFEHSHTVVLTGPDGTGRRAAAVVVLRESADGDIGRLRELSDRQEDADEPVLEPNEIRPRDLLLLDLTESDDSAVQNLRPDLEGFKAAVRERGARLVIVVRPDHCDLLPQSFRSITVRIDRPPGADVLAKHLRAEHIEPPRTEPPPELRRYLDEAPLREIAALADLAAEARASGHGASAAAWLDNALDAGRNRGDKAAVLFRSNQDAGDRALLVVAAFARGASLETVVAAEREFRTAVHLLPSEGHWLDGPYLAQRMSGVHLQTDGRTSVEFTELALDNAVRTHFWTYFPELRPGLTTWVRKAVALPGIDDALAAALVDRYAEQALATGSVKLLQDLAWHWATSSPDHRGLAYQILGAGLRDPAQARFLRKYVYDRSRNADLAVGFSDVLINVCVRIIAPARPIQALVRLHNFTRHHAEPVRTAAHVHLLDLVRARGYERWLIHRLAEPPPPLRASDRAILLDLHLPPGLTDSSTTRKLEVLWGRLLDDDVDTDAAPGLERWLDERPELLIRACTGQVRLLNRLYCFTRDRLLEAPGAPDREVRKRRAETLHHHLAAVLAAPAPPEPEERS